MIRTVLISVCVACTGCFVGEVVGGIGSAGAAVVGIYDGWTI